MVQKSVTPYIRQYKAKSLELNNSGNWVIGYLYNNKHDYLISRIEIMNDLNETAYVSDKIDINTLCEETGLVDVLGEPIFTNDVVILKHTLHPVFDNGKEIEVNLPKYGYNLHKEPAFAGGTYTTFYRNYRVEFYPEGHESCGYRIRHKDVFKPLKITMNYNHDMTIVGNIFDNPDWQTTEYRHDEDQLVYFW